MPDSNGQPDNIATVVAEVSERMTLLVRDEIELAKTEVMQKARSFIRGAVAVAAGAVFGVYATVFALLAIAWGINDLIGHLWPGFVIVFVLLLILTIAAFLFAWRKFKVGPPAPTMAIDEAKKIRDTVSTSSEGDV